MHLLLIRHGETEWNAQGRWQGWADAPLAAAGHEQAKLLGTYLARQPIRAVYSSDLARAAVTADRIAERHGLTVMHDPDLRELHIGVLQGLTHSEIRERFPHEDDAMRLDYMGHRVEGGESRQMLQNRVYAAFQRIVEAEYARDPNGTIVVVGHGSMLRVLLMRLFPLHDRLLRIPIGNTSITTLRYTAGHFELVHLPETPHLVIDGRSGDTTPAGSTGADRTPEGGEASA
jgi:broad specificity phosphatase PhoE